MQSAYKEYAVPMRENTLGSWLETVVISAIALALGYIFSPADPLLATADFPWMIFAPLLVAVRYGFLPGLLSAGILVIGILVHSLIAHTALPTSYLIGMLLSTFLVGEFRDIWHKKLMTLYMANEYRQYRLDDFTRSYRLLQVSHDALELRIAGSNRSLRSTLLLLRNSLQNAPTAQQHDLATLAEQAMQVFNQYTPFTAAGLYPVTKEQALDINSLVTFGDMPLLDAQDVLLKACLANKKTVSIRDQLLTKGANPSQLQVCIPLLDTEQNWFGILAIKQMPFFSMTEQNLNLLALLAGHVADLMQSDDRALQLHSAQAQHFSQQLQRCHLNNQTHNLSAALIAFELNEHNEALRQTLEQSQRGLDLQLLVNNQREHQLLLVLLPLTSEKGTNGYLERIEALIAQQFPEQNLSSLQVTVRRFQIDQTNLADLGQFIYQECALDEQQVAI